MDDPSTIRAVDLEFAVICECGICPYEGVERVHGRVSAKRGPIVYSGTIEHSEQWYRDWAVMGRRDNMAGIRTYSLPTWTNHHEFPGGRQDPEILRLEALYGPDTFAMRCAAEPRPPRNRVIPELQPKHVREWTVAELREAHPDVVFEICVDPGYAFAYAIVIMARWQEEVDDFNPATGAYEKRKAWRFHCMSELYEQNLPTLEMIRLLRAHPLWPELVANPKPGGVFDIASKGHRDGGESALEIWEKNLPRFTWNMKYWLEDRLIERIRTSARLGHFTISKECRGLLAEVGLGEPVFPGMHPWRYLESRDGSVASEKPIDKWNHSIKALGYYLMHHLGQTESYSRTRSYNRLAGNKPKRTLASAA